MSGQLERLLEEKSLMQSDLSVKTSEITLLKTNEKRLVRDCAETRERAKSLEEEIHKVHIYIGVLYRYYHCASSESSVADPDPGSWGAFLTLDPGSGIGFFRIPDLLSRIPDPIVLIAL
jgi:hypothetical protein